jgi:hypothetical protein
VMAVVARTDGPGAEAMGSRLARSVGELRDQLSPGCAIAVRGQALRSAGRPDSNAAALAAEVEAVLAAARAGAPTPA